MVDGTHASDIFVIVNVFNSFVSNISSTLNASVNKNLDFSKLAEHLRKKLDNIIFIIPRLSPEFFFKKALLQAKSTGVDNVHAKLLRVGAPVISFSLTKVLNVSIDSATFPEIFKCARIVSIYKGYGNATEMSN